MKTIYHLLFYKLYKAALIVRSKYSALFVTSLIIGPLLLFAVSHILTLLGVYNDIPEIIVIVIYALSIPVNIFYFMKKGMPERLISERESKKAPLLYHIIVYLLLAWSLLGAFL